MTNKTMKTTMRTLAAVFSFCLAAGCGAPTDLDVCNADCDTARRCNLTNDVMTANCHTSCNNMSGTHAQNDQSLAAQCSNVGTIRQDQLNCLSNSDSCNPASVATCQIASLGNCLKK